MNETEGDLDLEQYRDLAEFRRQIRQFIYFSEATARGHSVEPQQHQLLLTVRGLPEGVKPTIGEIASRLFIRHHSAVELVNRLEAAGFVERAPGKDDRREVQVQITPAGHLVLRQLALAHREELETSGPQLARALASVLKKPMDKRKPRH